MSKRVPATTAFPSGWTARPQAVSFPPKSVVTLPPEPNVGSKSPRAAARSVGKSSAPMPKKTTMERRMTPRV
jgi:hypothetical protein